MFKTNHKFYNTTSITAYLIIVTIGVKNCMKIHTYLEILDHKLNYLEKSKVFVNLSKRVGVGHGWKFSYETF